MVFDRHNVGTEIVLLEYIMHHFVTSLRTVLRLWYVVTCSTVDVT